jgi:SAM-dependent methyltransferase
MKKNHSNKPINSYGMFKFILNKIPRPLLISLSNLARPLLDFYYRGKLYTDPINGKSYRKFLPYGYVNIRENVLSPGTLSLERHRLMWLYLQRETDFFSRSRKVLHLAPEQAFYKRFKKMPNIDYVTADLHSPLADIKADITYLPFDDETFDVIFCNHVLEHIPDDIQAMRELFRVMKSGGWGIFQIPLDRNRLQTFQDDSITDPQERTRIFGQYDHVRVYGWDYFDKLQSVGFEVRKIDYTSGLSIREVDKFRLEKGEILPVVYKK